MDEQYTVVRSTLKELENLVMELIPLVEKYKDEPATVLGGLTRVLAVMAVSYRAQKKCLLDNLDEDFEYIKKRREDALEKL